jgi:hypothetical protein
VLGNPVIRSHYRNGFIKEYARDEVILRTEPATNDVTDYGVGKAIENLPELEKEASRSRFGMTSPSYVPRVSWSGF